MKEATQLPEYLRWDVTKEGTFSRINFFFIIRFMKFNYRLTIC